MEIDIGWTLAHSILVSPIAIYAALRKPVAAAIKDGRLVKVAELKPVKLIETPKRRKTDSQGERKTHMQQQSLIERAIAVTDEKLKQASAEEVTGAIFSHFEQDVRRQRRIAREWAPFARYEDAMRGRGE